MDRSELESLVFASMVSMRLIDSYVRNNYVPSTTERLLYILERAFTKSNDVLVRHVVKMQPTNQAMIAELQGLALKLVEDTASVATTTSSEFINPTALQHDVDISEVTRLPTNTSTPGCPLHDNASRLQMSAANAPPFVPASARGTVPKSDAKLSVLMDPQSAGWSS